MKKYLAMFLIIICSSFSVFGEEGQNKEINDLKQRIEQLEMENKEVKINYSAKELFEKNDKKIEEIEKEVEDYKNNKIILLTIITILGVGGIGGIVPFVISLKKEVRAEIVNKVKQETEKINDVIITEYRERVKTEVIFRQHKKILILYKDEFKDLSDKLEKISLREFLPHYFKNVEFINIDSILLEQTKGYDLILFAHGEKADNLKDNYIYPKAQNIIDSLDGTNTVFYYHNEKRKNQALDRCYINNSSSFITLYRNIMDTLEFQEYLEQKSKNNSSST